MTSDESTDRSQRTVAELLAQYGEGAAAPGGRRRARRRSEDTGAQPAADPSTSQPPAQDAAAAAQGPNGDHAPPGPETSPPTDLFEAGAQADGPRGPQQRHGAGAPPGPPRQSPSPQNGPPSSPGAQAGGPGYAQPPRREPPPAYPSDPDTAGYVDPVAAAETAPWYPQAGMVPDGPAAQLEPPTDQLHLHGTNGGVVRNGRVDHGPVGPPAERLDEPGDPTAAGIPLDDLDPRDAAAFGPVNEPPGDLDVVPAVEAHRVDRAEAEGSPATAWLAMIAQWIGGAIGGAALWVAFRYLWTAMPVVALVAAVLVTGGLVLLVRAIRRSDDLKTTVFAVLVGLVVTVSPAVLVLVTR